MTAKPATASSLRTVCNVGLIVAVGGGIAGGVGWLVTPDAFYRAYLHGWMLWLGVSLGSMGLTMVVHLLGGAWGHSIRRPAEAAAMMLPLLVVLFAPIAVGVCAGKLYPWAHGDAWRDDPILIHRHPYLNLPFFFARAAAYAVVWIATAVVLWWGSRARDEPLSLSSSGLTAFSGPALMAYLLTMGLFASTDWLLALEPHYKSTVFGLIVIAGQGVSALCVLIPMLVLLDSTAAPAVRIDADIWNDLASVLLTAVLLWGYLEVCQYLVNWMSNTQDENRWYLQRLSHGWGVLSGLLVLFHVAVPGLLLLMRSVKRNAMALLGVCVLLLVCRAVDEFWTVNPSGADPMPLLFARFSWLDVMLPVAIGGAWVSGYAWLLMRSPIGIAAEPLPAEGAYVG